MKRRFNLRKPPCATLLFPAAALLWSSCGDLKSSPLRTDTQTSPEKETQSEGTQTTPPLHEEITEKPYAFPIPVAAANTMYTSPDGSGDSFTRDHPGSVQDAVDIAKPGDVIRLLPGTYAKIIMTRSGEPDLPITLVSDSTDSDNFALIDGGNTKGDKGNQGLVIRESSWIVVQNLKFRNCWRNIIELDNSSYITIRGCDFREGEHVIAANGSGAHHILAENNIWVQHVKTWNEWNWEEIHHESLSHYNGGFIGAGWKNAGPGASVLRNNRISYAFNGLQMWAEAENQYANMEIYGNWFSHIHDNSIEPERHSVNLHIYHNEFHNNQSLIFSFMHTPEGEPPEEIHDGPIYVYGNVGTFDKTDKVASPNKWIMAAGGDPGEGGIIKNVRWANPETPVYFFHNSFYGYGGIGGIGNSKLPTNFAIHFFNNATWFTGPEKGKPEYGVRSSVTKAQGNLFDYNCTNTRLSAHMRSDGQESNGLLETDPDFKDPMGGDLRLAEDSPAIDSGKVIDGFTQAYQGDAPDMGAFEGDQLVEGPPFYIVVPKGGLGYVEKPRITRHRINGNQLTLFYSWPLKPKSLSSDTYSLTLNGQAVSITDVRPGRNAREVVIITQETLPTWGLSLNHQTAPVGENGESATLWASTLDMRPRPEAP